MTATEASSASFPHTEIAARLLDGRTWAGSPAVSPDGQTIAFVVSTINLGENTTVSRIWLAGPTGEPAPVTNGPHDTNPTWSPDGRWLAFASRRGEKEHESTLHVLPVDGPGEVRTIATMPDGIDDLTWSPDGKWLGYTSRTRDPRYDAKDERWQAPREDRDVLHPPRQRRLDLRPTRSTCTSPPPTARARRAT